MLCKLAYWNHKFNYWIRCEGWLQNIVTVIYFIVWTGVLIGLVWLVVTKLDFLVTAWAIFLVIALLLQFFGCLVNTVLMPFEERRR